MKLQQEILEYLNQEASPAGKSEKEIAQALGVFGSELAGALKAMVQSGQLTVTRGRPARYKPGEVTLAASHPRGEDEPFSALVGAGGSLYVPIQTLKATVAYPPFGLHILITGSSGVGKTQMAHEAWRYACKINRLRKRPEPPFVIFNCAEYNDNPQLLLAELFGYVRGAFTGADSDHEGLVSKANGGILFLDEIHRLPAAGQEMFFSLLDHGKYRPMGSVESKCANIMLIGATTESIDSVLLETFRRRIPMSIALPDLSERPLDERMELIRLFFFQGSAVYAATCTFDRRCALCFASVQ